MVLKSTKLIITSKFENVSLVGLAINKICTSIPFTKVEAYQTELCVVEALNNVIKYAYQNNPDFTIEINVNLYIDKITIEICDTGVSMSQKISSTLDFDPDDLDQIPAGGMGLFIINEVMNRVNYRNHNGENILTLTKYYNSDEDRG